MVEWGTLPVNLVSYQTDNFDTELADLVLWQLLNFLDNTKTVISVFIDFNKALSTIDLTILLQMMNHYGIRCIIIIIMYY